VSDIEAFRVLIEEELARYARETGYGPLDLTSDRAIIDHGDAEFFVAGINSGLVDRCPKGEYWLPASRWSTMAFLEGSKGVTPKQVHLFVEGIITVATAARLHLEYGWPKGCLGFEAEDQSFDLIGRLPKRRWYSLAGEAKSSDKLLGKLLGGIERCGALGSHEESIHEMGQKNAHRKWRGLVSSHAPVLMAYGPGRDWRVFLVHHGPGRRLTLEATKESALVFSTFARYPTGRRPAPGPLGPAPS
jgi:hypothetical protein